MENLNDAIEELLIEQEERLTELRGKGSFWTMTNKPAQKTTEGKDNANRN